MDFAVSGDLSPFIGDGFGNSSSTALF